MIAAELPSPAAAATLDSPAARIRGTSDVASVSPPVVDQAGDAGLIVVYPRTDPQAAPTAGLVTTLRSAVIPATAGIDLTSCD